MGIARAIGDIRTMKALWLTAEDIARRDGDGLAGAEHLLLAAIALPDGTARRAFARVGADAGAVEGAIAAQHDDALRAVGIAPPPLPDPPVEMRGPSGPLRTAESARAAWLDALERLRRERPKRALTGADIVAAVARMEHGTAARALRAMGVDRHALEAAASEEIAAAA